MSFSLPWSNSSSSTLENETTSLLPGSSSQTPDSPQLGDILSTGNIANTLLRSIVGSNAAGFESQVTALTEATSLLPGNSSQTSGTDDPPLGDILSTGNIANTLIRSIVGSNAAGFESQVAALTEATSLLPGNSSQNNRTDDTPRLGDVLSAGNIATTLLRSIVGSNATGFESQVTALTEATSLLPGNSSQTPRTDDPPRLGDILSTGNIANTLMRSIAGSNTAGFESQVAALTETATLLPGNSSQTPRTDDPPHLGGILSTGNIANTLIRSIVGNNSTGFESQVAALTETTSLLPGNFNQTPRADNPPQPGDILSTGNIANTLIRSIVGNNATGFESQVTALTEGSLPGSIISQIYQATQSPPGSSQSDSSGSSGFINYGAIAKAGIGIAYTRLAEGSETDETEIGDRVGPDILGSGLKLVETALTWPFELLGLIKNSIPLITGFILQYSLTLASVFAAGHLGKDELAAVSLATMTANLTGYALYQGLATALDTLCAQSYGAGMHKQVGLHFQRCVILLMLVSIPIGYIWLSSPYILRLIVPDEKLADMAGGYLRILFLGAPGYALFEAGKKYMQAQGIYHASTAVLAFLAPLNAFMNFALVWDEFLGLGFGFYGAPIAVVITNWLMPICLAYYVIFIDGSKCWHPLTFRAFTNWGPILSLALPGVAMIESEFLAFELLTLFSSYFGTSTLAAQSILATLMSFIYQIPFGMSISSCTAVAQYVGAGDKSSARRSAYVAMGIAIVFGVIDAVILISLREHIGKPFSTDPQIIALVAETIPVCAAFQVVDVLASVTGGILRGQGRQHIAGLFQVPAYYGLAIPISLYTSFKLNWGIRGLWTGCACALVFLSFVQTLAVLFADWDKVVKEAADRVANETTAEDREDIENGVRERLLGFGRGSG